MLSIGTLCLPFTAQTLAILVMRITILHTQPRLLQLGAPGWRGADFLEGTIYLGVFPQGNSQKRARLQRRGTPDHTYTPHHSLEKCPDTRSWWIPLEDCCSGHSKERYRTRNCSVFDLLHLKHSEGENHELEMGKSNAKASLQNVCSLHTQKQFF